MVAIEPALRSPKPRTMRITFISGGVIIRARSTRPPFQREAQIPVHRIERECRVEDTLNGFAAVWA